MNIPASLADDFIQAVKAQVAMPAANAPAYALARSAGFSERCIQMLEKAAVGGVVSSTSPGDSMTTLSNGSKAWFSTLRSISVFARLLEAGMLRLPLQTAYGIATSTATAYIVNEGKPSPLTLFGASKDALSPVKAMALMAVSNDVVRASDQGSIDAMDAEMRGAVAAAIDAKFWLLAGSGATGFSLGPTGGTFRADTQELLEAVSTTGNGGLVWCCAPDVAVKACFFDEFMSATGGEILGLPAIVSSVIPSGTLRLVDAKAFAGNLENIEIEASNNATLEMKDGSLTQDATAGTGVSLVSSFQTGMTSIRALATFGAAKVRSTGAHEITGIVWGS
jgi:hypothetical protein